MGAALSTLAITDAAKIGITAGVHQDEDKEENPQQDMQDSIYDDHSCKVACLGPGIYESLLVSESAIHCGCNRAH